MGFLLIVWHFAASLNPGGWRLHFFSLWKYSTIIAPCLPASNSGPWKRERERPRLAVSLFLPFALKVERKPPWRGLIRRRYLLSLSRNRTDRKGRVCRVRKRIQQPTFSKGNPFSILEACQQIEHTLLASRGCQLATDLPHGNRFVRVQKTLWPSG